MAVSAISVKRLTVPKASDVLAAHLRETILRGDLVEGSPLPTERELGERSGLSRPSVREALRILESEGLIQTRPGRGGGLRSSSRRRMQLRDPLASTSEATGFGLRLF